RCVYVYITSILFLDQYYNPHDGDFDPNGKIPTGIDSLHDEFSQNTPSDTLSIVQIRAQYAEELYQVEEEIETLKQVLTAKYRRQAFLKQQLGITVMNELRSGINKSMDTLRTTDAFQKTSAVVKSATVKTSAVIHEKWNFLKQTDAFKSFEDKLGSAYSSVRLPPTLRQFSLTGPTAFVSCLSGNLVPSPALTMVLFLCACSILSVAFTYLCVVYIILLLSYYLLSVLTVHGKLVRSKTLTGAHVDATSSQVQLFPNIQATFKAHCRFSGLDSAHRLARIKWIDRMIDSNEVHCSNDDDVKQENSTSSQSVIADTRPDQGEKNGVTVSPNGTLQMESLAIEADANDETEEFVQTSRSKSNQRQKQKPKSFAD
ncbi:uncharacterized protein DEA37_0007071, partial [Paragonimus westermani]